MNIEDIQKRLVNARGDRTQKEVARVVGISESALAMYESGKRVPRDEVKEALAEYYGMTVGFLFFGEKVHDTCTCANAAG